MYTRENYYIVKQQIEQRRISAENQAMQRNEELRDSFPEIREIDKELSNTGLLLFKTACDGGDIDKIRSRNEALMKKRAELLKKLGFDEDYTKPRYTCPVCQDSGFVKFATCKCFRELLTKKNIESSGMGHLIEKQSFDNFNLDFYSYDKSVYERMESNLGIAKRFAENFANHRENLLLIGTTGTGKTHISTSIARVVIEMGFDVLYDSVQNILEEFENDRFRSGYGQREPAAQKYLECDLLIIDDLGTELSTQFTASCLYNLINTRQNKGLSTIISTNLSSKELSNKYEGRIYSRIIGSDYKVLFFCGKDHRIS